LEILIFTQKKIVLRGNFSQMGNFFNYFVGNYYITFFCIAPIFSQFNADR